MSTREAGAPFHYDDLMEVVRRRRSVRRFEKGKTVGRDLLLRIAEAGRWGPTGANAQPWDLVIVDDPVQKQAVLDVFLRQSPLLGFASLGGAIANCGGNSGIALTSSTLDPAAASQIADYMQRAARVLRSLNLPGVGGAPATSWQVQRCQDGSSKWYAINAPTGRACLLLNATGLLSLEEFVPAGNTTA